jgi:hypothetical protein
MSSHHFVKENQEPDLFIVDAFSRAQAEPLLEWAPEVIVAEPALDRVLSWGIKIDVIIVKRDPDREFYEKVQYQAPVRAIVCAADKDYLSAGVEYLTMKPAKAVNVLAESPLPWFSLRYDAMGFQVSVITASLKWSLAGHRRYEKWLAKGSRMRIHFQRQPMVFEFDGLTAGEEFFTAKHDGMVRIRSDQSFWVGEPI